MTKKLNCILLIDDDPDDIVFHKIIINKVGCAHNIDHASNGIEALAYLKKAGQPPPELIFLDINMPRMNGWEFLEQYRHLDEAQKSRIVILFLTTSSSRNDIRKAKEFKEVSGFETKPLTEETLMSVLGQYFSDYL